MPAQERTHVLYLLYVLCIFILQGVLRTPASMIFPSSMPAQERMQYILFIIFSMHFHPAGGAEDPTIDEIFPKRSGPSKHIPRKLKVVSRKLAPHLVRGGRILCSWLSQNAMCVLII